MVRRLIAIALLALAALAPGAAAATGVTPLARAPQPRGALDARAGLAQPQGTVCSGPTRAWHDGTPVDTSTFNPLPDPGGVVLHTIHWAGYFGACDTSWPRLGDTFYVRVVAGVVNPLQAGAPPT